MLMVGSDLFINNFVNKPYASTKPPSGIRTN